MTYQLQISSAVRNDLADAFSWYDKQQKGLGNEFLQEVFLTLDAVTNNPFLFAISFPANFVLAKQTGFRI